MTQVCPVGFGEGLLGEMLLEAFGELLAVPEGGGTENQEIRLDHQPPPPLKTIVNRTFDASS